MRKNRQSFNLQAALLAAFQWSPAVQNILRMQKIDTAAAEDIEYFISQCFDFKLSDALKNDLQVFYWAFLLDRARKEIPEVLDELDIQNGESFALLCETIVLHLPEGSVKHIPSSK